MPHPRLPTLPVHAGSSGRCEAAAALLPVKQDRQMCAEKTEGQKPSMLVGTGELSLIPIKETKNNQTKTMQTVTRIQTIA